MKAGLALLVTMIALSPLPASAKSLKAQPVSLTTDELPLTDQFADLLTSYRNCVLMKVDATSSLGAQQDMARQAMSACALSRGELQAQLISDIRAQQPAISNAVALRSAESGMAQVDPMIEAAAIDRAHIRYARTMY
jgi:hypothetical protein